MALHGEAQKAQLWQHKIYFLTKIFKKQKYEKKSLTRALEGPLHPALSYNLGDGSDLISLGVEALTWSNLFPLGPTWIHLDSTEFARSHVVSHDLAWSHLDSRGLARTRVHSPALIQSSLNSLGLMWIHLASLEHTWTHLDSLTEIIGIIWK